jgi:hypothetical protein
MNRIRFALHRSSACMTRRMQRTMSGTCDLLNDDSDFVHLLLLEFGGALATT